MLKAMYEGDIHLPGTKLTAKIIWTIAFAIIACYFLFPIFWLLVSTTKSNAQLFEYLTPWLPPHLSIVQNFEQLFTYDSGEYVRWLENSFLYAVVGGLGATILSTMAGYSFAKYDYSWMRSVFWIILGSIFVPVTALALPIFIIMQHFQLINTYWAVILPSVVSPFGVYLIRIYADQGIPESLLEAARIDGASEWKVFWHIGSRLLTPAASTVFLFSFVANWNNFFLPLIVLNGSSKFPVNLGLSVWNSLNTEGHAKMMYNLVITGSVLAIVPVAISFVLLQRYWKFGLASGSVNGE